MILKLVSRELKVGKKFLQFMLIKGFSLGILFFVPLILAHALGPANFGAYSLAITVIYFLNSVFSLASSEGVVVYSNKEFADTGKMNESVSAWLYITAFAISVSLILSFLLMEPIIRFTSITFREFLFLILAYLGLVVKSTFQSLLLTMNKRIISVLYEALTNILAVVYIFSLFYFSLIRLDFVFLVFLIPSVIGAAVLFKYVDFHHMKPFQVEKKKVMELVNFTKWTTMTVLVVQLINVVDNLVLRLYVPLQDIGIFNLGFQIFKGLVMVTGAINVYFAPWAARNVRNPSKVKDYLYKKRVKIMALVTVVLIAGYFILPLFFDLVYGKTYAGSSATAQVLLVAAFFSFYGTFYRPFFNALEEYRFAQISRIVMLAANVAVDLVLIPRYGYIGSAYAMVISIVLSTVVTEIYFQKKMKGRLFND